MKRFFTALFLNNLTIKGKRKAMLIKRRLQNVFLIETLALLGLLLMISIGFTQGGAWSQKANIPTARALASSCELNGKIYVIGGAQTLYSCLKTMEVYDPDTDTWDTTKTDMPTARAELCVAAVNGKIYAIGGALSHQGTTLGVVEEYDTLTDSWITKAPMPTARKGSACGVWDDKIYIAGGSAVSNWVPSKKLEIYDPASDQWTSGADMPAARYEPEGAVLNDTFYVSGGIIGSPWTGQTAVQKYDPISNNWSPGTNLYHGRVGFTTNAIYGKIYAIGGDTQPPVQENVEEYNPQTETWAVIDSTPSVMICHTSSVYNNEIFVFSGSPTGISPLTLTDSVYSYNPVPSSIESQKNLTPDIFVLHQNYPNPFNPSTTIEFTLPRSSHVSLKILNILGEAVASLHSGYLLAGSYQYEWSPPAGIASGVYLYRLQAGDFVETKKMVLMR
jgi:N-acetylneuraminic acid mutarotase